MDTQYFFTQTILSSDEDDNEVQKERSKRRVADMILNTLIKKGGVEEKTEGNTYYLNVMFGATKYEHIQ